MSNFGQAPVRNVSPDHLAIADNGSYFLCNNAQTGLATAATPTAFSATNPFVLIYNKDSAKSIYLDFVTLIATAPGTAGASVQAAVSVDLAANRYSSGGTELTPNIANPNGNATGTSIARVWGGNITATAATSQARNLVGNRFLKGAIPVAGDEYTVKFGGVDAPNWLGISTIIKTVINVPKVIIPPGGSGLVYIWLPSQSAASSYIPELGWVEV